MSVCVYVEDGVLLRSEDESRCESNKSPVRMQNACGTVYIEDRRPIHCAWRRSTSIFGIVLKAYTTAGNMVLQRQKISFKGALQAKSLSAVIKDLVAGSFKVRLQLVVLSVGIGRCLFVNVECTLEVRLRRVPWVRVMNRIEEVCNVVVFYVKDWKAMEKDLKLRPILIMPKSTTVSVTRRGTLTLRMTWEGIDWESNEDFEAVTGAMATFVKDLI